VGHSLCVNDIWARRGVQSPTGLLYCCLVNKCVLLKCFRVHMHDLKDVTNNVHYENFRYSHLATVTSEGQKTKPVTTSKYVVIVVCDI